MTVTQSRITVTLWMNCLSCSV